MLPSAATTSGTFRLTNSISTPAPTHAAAVLDDDEDGRPGYAPPFIRVIAVGGCAAVRCPSPLFALLLLPCFRCLIDNMLSSS